MHPLLRAAAERQSGVFTAVDAHRAGYESLEIRHLCASGRWRRLRRGVYVAADVLARAEDDGRRYQLECLAVLLALRRPTGALSHASAARLSGLTLRPPPDALIRLTDPLHNRRGRGFSMTRAPLEAAEVRALGAYRLTGPARTLVDCAREVPLEDAVVAMDAALLAGQVRPRELSDAVTRARPWPGGRRAERAVLLADGRAESPLETRGRLRIVGAGLPTPDLQREIRSAGRLVAVVDAWFDDEAVAVEFDGRIKYTDPWRDGRPTVCCGRRSGGRTNCEPSTSASSASPTPNWAPRGHGRRTGSARSWRPEAPRFGGSPRPRAPAACGAAADRLALVVATRAVRASDDDHEPG